MGNVRCREFEELWEIKGSDGNERGDFFPRRNFQLDRSDECLLLSFSFTILFVRFVFP